MHQRISLAACVSALLFFCSAPQKTMAVEVDEQLLLDLKSLVEKQQQRLDNQEAEMRQLKKIIADLKGETPVPADQKENSENLTQTRDLVTTGNKNAEVQLYGHVNRAVLWADDGNASKAYFVDNLNSQTRMGLKASILATDDLSMGTWIEYGIVSNSSGDVNRENDRDATSTHFNKRHMDLYLLSKQFGKLSLGHGSTASDGSAEMDLSGTTVASYSPIQDMTGGQLFYDRKNDTVSGITIKSVYSNMDGLSRRDRLRYDTPEFIGFSAAASVISGDAGDISLRYNRSFPGMKFASAVAWAKPGDILSSVDNQYDASLAVLLDNGLNATLAGGLQDMQENSRDDGSFWYAKLGYQVKLFSFGQSNISVDYGRSESLAENDDQFSSFGLAFVQNIVEWGTELYIACRWHKLDRSDEDLAPINAVMSGARIKF